MRRACLLSLLAFAGCVTMPRDPLSQAEAACTKGNLALALRLLDSVPVAYPGYPEARARAVGIEQRMRKSQEFLLQGLALRMEWRDQEAIVAFQRAREIWLELPGVDNMIAATRNRLIVFGPHTIPDPAAVPVERDAPPPAAAGTGAAVGDARPQASPVTPVAPISSTLQPPAAEPAAPEAAPTTPAQKSAPAAEPAAIAPSAAESAPAPEAATPPDMDPITVPAAPMGEGAKRERPQAADAPAGAPATVDRPGEVGVQLADIETTMSEGDVESALQQLLLVQHDHPDDARVRIRMARVLHQRALLRYGHGDVKGAVADWQRAIALDPGMQEVRRVLQQAEEELQQKQAPQEKKAGG